MREIEFVTRYLYGNYSMFKNGFSWLKEKLINNLISLGQKKSVNFVKMKREVEEMRYVEKEVEFNLTQMSLSIKKRCDSVKKDKMGISIDWETW